MSDTKSTTEPARARFVVPEALWRRVFAAPRTGRRPSLDAVAGSAALPGDPAAIALRLARAASRRCPLAHSGRTSALRLADGEADALDGVAGDVYGGFAVVHLRSDEALARRDDVLDAVASFGFDGVYVKCHPRHASTLADPRRDDVAPGAPSRGRPAPDAADVLEDGLAYECRLGDGLATGLYLDQRDNRRRVREAARGRHVLNLFGYTGSFSVAAAAGGASRTTTVDVSRVALAQAGDNLRRNGHDAPAHRTVTEDAVVFLRRAAVRRDRFDFIVVDPPSFATTKTTRFSAVADYGLLARAAAAVLAPGGVLLACTNHRSISIARLRAELLAAAKVAGLARVRVRALPPAPDFAPAPGAEPAMKSLWLDVG